MGIKNSWVLVLFVAGIASCATSSKSTPIRETTAETKAEVPVDSTSTKDATQPPDDGEITLDGAKTTEVDIGVTGTSTGPVLVDSAIQLPEEEMQRALLEAMARNARDIEPSPIPTEDQTVTDAINDSTDIEKPAPKADKKAKKKDEKKGVEKPKVPGQLIIDSGDAAPVAVPAEP